mgnify:CR=1 FL=1
MPYQDTNSHVDLGKHGPALPDLLGQLLVHRGHHPARTASVGIEIDDDRKAGLGRVLLEEAIEFVRRPDMPDQRRLLRFRAPQRRVLQQKLGMWSRALKKPGLQTVDSFQGSECSVVCLSVVRSS